MSLELRAHRISDVVIVDLVGRLDYRAPAFSPQVADLVACGERHLILNLSQLDYVDAAGLGQLVRAATSVMKNGGTLILLRPQERIRRLIGVTRLDRIFEIYEVESQAIARSQASRGRRAHTCGKDTIQSPTLRRLVR
jgi:anti-sigma B factor antagonist